MYCKKSISYGWNVNESLSQSRARASKKVAIMPELFPVLIGSFSASARAFQKPFSSATQSVNTLDKHHTCGLWFTLECLAISNRQTKFTASCVVLFFSFTGKVCSHQVLLIKAPPKCVNMLHSAQFFYGKRVSDDSQSSSASFTKELIWKVTQNFIFVAWGYLICSSDRLPHFQFWCGDIVFLSQKMSGWGALVWKTVHVILRSSWLASDKLVAFIFLLWEGLGAADQREASFDLSCTGIATQDLGDTGRSAPSFISAMQNHG